MYQYSINVSSLTRSCFSCSYSFPIFCNFHIQESTSLFFARRSLQNLLKNTLSLFQKYTANHTTAGLAPTNEDILKAVSGWWRIFDDKFETVNLASAFIIIINARLQVLEVIAQLHSFLKLRKLSNRILPSLQQLLFYHQKWSCDRWNYYECIESSQTSIKGTWDQRPSLFLRFAGINCFFVVLFKILNLHFKI